MMPLAPTNVQVIGDELAVAWNDGGESFLRLEALRRGCPCAACSGEPDVMGRVEKPGKRFGEKSFSLRGIRIVGGYALQPEWEDGHSSGLYSFDYLRRLAGGAQR